MCKKIAMLGGSFNPIHNGHIKLALNAIKEANLDEVLIMPANIPPHKENNLKKTSKYRYNMCKLACEKYNKINVSDIEINSKGKNYTIKTLKILQTNYPNSELFLIVGADMYLTLESWRSPKDIFKLSNIITAPRNNVSYIDLLNYSNKLKDFGANTIILKEKIMDISSTKIRDEIAKGIDVSKYIDEKVLEYINLKGLYRQ